MSHEFEPGMVADRKDAAAIAGLRKSFEACVSAFNTIGTAYNQNLDLIELVLKLNVEKCRLYTWGMALGLATVEVGDTARLTCPVQGVVKETLDTLQTLLDDPEQLKQFYGCKQYIGLPGSVEETPSQISRLALAFGKFNVNDTYCSSYLEKTERIKWTIGDRSKFQALVADIADNIDDLRVITDFIVKPSALDQNVCARIDNITDEETLTLLSQVCRESYPDLSATAAQKASLIATMSMDRWKIEYWKCGAVNSSSNITDTYEQLDFTVNQDLPGVRVQDSNHIEDADSCRSHVAAQPVGLIEMVETSGDRCSSLACQHVIDSDDLTHPRIVKPLLMPIVVGATKRSVNEEQFSIDLDGIEEDFDEYASVRFEDPITECSEDEETACARSESSITITGESLSDSVAYEPSGRRQQQPGIAQRHKDDAPTEAGRGRNSMANGFMDFDIITSGKKIKDDDYFVLSFDVTCREMRSQLSTSHGHTHYVNVTYVARVVRTDAYVPFDLESWPRDLSISGFVDATEMDETWVGAMRNSRLQVNVYASSLKLPFCRAPDGGCLKSLFGTLADNRLIAKCSPNFAVLHENQPEVFIVPIGKSAFLPRFITYNDPHFSPSIDVLLILLVFRRPGSDEM